MPSNEQSLFGNQLLLRELTHRVNNDFAAAIAIVSLTAARTPSKEVRAALATVERRLHNYVQVQRCLGVPPTSKSIDASAHLRKLCQSISRARLDRYGIELLFVECPFELESDRCWSLGMIVSELITRSSRHVFDPGRGKIVVELSRSGSFARCRVADNGVCEPKEKLESSSEIVAVLPTSLHGTIERSFGPQRNSSDLIFPLYPAVTASKQQ